MRRGPSAGGVRLEVEIAFELPPGHVHRGRQAGKVPSITSILGTERQIIPKLDLPQIGAHMKLGNHSSGTTQMDSVRPPDPERGQPLLIAAQAITIEALTPDTEHTVCQLTPVAHSTPASLPEATAGAGVLWYADVPAASLTIPASTSITTSLTSENHSDSVAPLQSRLDVGSLVNETFDVQTLHGIQLRLDHGDTRSNSPTGVYAPPSFVVTGQEEQLIQHYARHLGRWASIMFLIFQILADLAAVPSVGR